MQTEHIVSLLVAERDRLNRAIHALQGHAKRRGRPTGSGAAPAHTAPAKRKRRRSSMSAAARKQQSERMKAFWAARRKKKSK